MEPLAFVEPLDKRTDLPTRLVARTIRLVMDHFTLERAEEALGHGIVVAEALPTQTIDPLSELRAMIDVALKGHATEEVAVKMESLSDRFACDAEKRTTSRHARVLAVGLGNNCPLPLRSHLCPIPHSRSES